MLAAYPADLGDIDRAKPTRCIEECVACAYACSACADACLSEGMVGDLAKCIRTDMDRATCAPPPMRSSSDIPATTPTSAAAILTACAVAPVATAGFCRVRPSGLPRHWSTAGPAVRQDAGELMAGRAIAGGKWC